MKWKQAVPRVPPLVCNQWEQGSGDVAVSANFREHDRTWKMTAVSTWRRATSAMNLDSVLTKPNIFTSIASSPPFRASQIASVSRPPLRPEPQGHQVQEYLGMGFEGRQRIQGPL